MGNFTLKKEEAIALAKQQSIEGKIKLSAINYNWGVPISGRFDVDGLIAWAKINDDSLGRVFLQGTREDQNWDLNIEFENVGEYIDKNTNKKFKLFMLKLDSQYTFPVEFVLRYESADEKIYYDNNFYKNYKIIAYSGYGGSAVVGEEAIFDFKKIINYSTYFKKIIKN